MANITANNGGFLSTKEGLPDLDLRYGPYESVDIAQEALEEDELITTGLTVGIWNNDKTQVTEYWWQGGTTINHLVQRAKPSKLKRIFFLLAAMLLSCASAFAQSGNSEPIKGDVNGDGKVDIADIVAIVNIMKTNQEPSTTLPDYYVGWTNGTKSQFRGKSDTDLINGATGYSISSNPTYTRAFGDNNIFYLLYQADKAPTQVIFTSQNTPQIVDVVNDNICPHDDVIIDGVTYKEFGIRLGTGYDPVDSITIRFN